MVLRITISWKRPAPPDHQKQTKAPQMLRYMESFHFPLIYHALFAGYLNEFGLFRDEWW
jgi:hypothetical protein